MIGPEDGTPTATLDLTPLLAPFIDDIVKRIVTEVTDRLAERLFGPTVVGEPAVEMTVPAGPTAPSYPPTLEGFPPRGRDVNHHTCERCGREGSRRFTKTEQGWVCTETVACHRRSSGSDIPAKPFQEDVTPEAAAPSAEEFCIHCLQHHDEHDRDELACPTRAGGFSRISTFEAREVLGKAPTPKPADPPPGVTARCQDCTRTWTLTGRVLETAVEMHEQKHAHIVNVYETAQ